MLGALIGIGGALGILTMVLLLVLLCKNKRSSSTSSSSSSYHGVELEKELHEPEYSQAMPGGQEKQGGGGDNVFIVDPIYQCSGCPSSYSTLKPIRQPCLPPAPYSSLRRPDYASSSSRRPLPNHGEATALLPPPPPSLSSGLGSSGSDLDNSRTNSDHSGGHSPRLISDTAV